MTSVLDQLKSMTKIVADTGDLAAVRRLRPEDCTTNPSLVLAAFQDPVSESLIAQELQSCRSQGRDAQAAAATLSVAIGAELAKLVPGRVSTEVDACLSFGIDDSVRRAYEIVEDYDARGVEKDRILIKLAATWEGIRAAEILQRDGIDCNLTLIFSLSQAIACADASVFLISPFVGRITDWYKKSEGRDSYAPDDDPGVASVKTIYDYYKSNGIETIVMGASFRTIDQVKALAGCDRLTIAPKLLDALKDEEGDLKPALLSDRVQDVEAQVLDEASFRWELNRDAMATEKLAEGIRNFDKDHSTLISMVTKRMSG